MAETKGFAVDGFQGVRDLLDSQLEDGRDLGASVTVHHRGEVVVDIWGGYTDLERTIPWVSDTLVNVWSTTKTMTFVVALLLAERGELDFDAPVSRYWPEFAAAGKTDVRFRHFLSHSAGLSGFAADLAPQDLADWDRCVRELANQTPWWEPGTASGYHAITQGYLIGEVVRRITGQSIGRFFDAEIAQPLGADFHIGLATDQFARVSPVVPHEVADPSTIDPSTIRGRTILSAGLNASSANEDWWKTAEIPAANGHGNARSVALIQSIITNRGETAGRRVLQADTVDRVFDTLMDGTDQVFGLPMRYGAGYGLSSETVPIGPRACFWGGFGGSLVMMDQSTDLTVAYMMNRMDVGLIGDIRGMMIVLAAAGAAAQL